MCALPDVELHFPARDTIIRSKCLPMQHIGTGRKPSYIGNKHVRRRLARQGECALLAVGAGE